MKQSIIALLACLFLVSCIDSHEYRVRFHAGDKDYDGCKVSLFSGYETNLQQAFAEAVIKKGRCELKGVTDAPGWYLLVLSRPDNSWTVTQLVYLDGSLRVRLNEDKFRVSGSKVNKVYAKFVDDYGKLAVDVVALNNRLMTNPSNVGLQRSLSQAYLKFESAYRQLAIETIAENRGNPAGIQILKSSASVLEDVDIERLLRGGDEAFLTDPFVRDLSLQLKRSRQPHVTP